LPSMSVKGLLTGIPDIQWLLQVNLAAL